MQTKEAKFFATATVLRIRKYFLGKQDVDITSNFSLDQDSDSVTVLFFNFTLVRQKRRGRTII
jgi:hypothetical protein